ncbi:hypothetical protein A3B87_02270 [Candidatus Kuenenbacteria bacterium RIFCSPHIGHO2_02_FULL_39_13]|uniref:tetrahydrofolate synthase n=1 Tax=Candidatus Kuenenbacteria bacterium RIFCSPHIGHO2_02_FULL_39_13 TaxID=1798561 RepID=A0A1F6FNR3_9BACT|nr:MAG: hypothetical protein A3B87_02270 [Candidatus Kuenenbacteria bacterium RIFCSPHIGHO2_02_FULL_39_13]
MFQRYYQTVKYLESLTNITKPEYMQEKGRDFYLRRTEELIKELKINLNQFKLIHITGTAGKGSVTALVHSILNEAGKKVGSFYSPHPTTSIERIKVADKYIAPDIFSDLMEKIKPLINKLSGQSKFGPASYFEIFFALALLYFQKKKCEYLVLEVGCGGEFDATNIIPAPKLAAITNIGYDHTHILGSSLAKIARAKAGIIKKGSVFVTTEKRPKILEIFHKICKNRGCAYRPVANITDEVWENNRQLAREIAGILGIEKNIIERGIAKTKLSCRFELMQRKPMVVLDGAHNYDKLKATFASLKKLKFNKLFLIFTLNKNKDVRKILKMVNNNLPPECEIYLTRHLAAERACADLKMMYNLFLSEKQIFIDPWEALNKALKKAGRDDLILVSGSFYLAGELRKKWVSEEKILKINS